MVHETPLSSTATTIGDTPAESFAAPEIGPAGVMEIQREQHEVEPAAV